MSVPGPSDRLLRRDYWLIFSRPLQGTSGADIAAHVNAHLEWLLGLEADGMVVLSGPLLDGPGTGPGSGMTVFRARDADEAAQLASRDPLVTAGLRTFDVYRWQVNEGSIDVRISLGTGRYTWR